MGKRRGIIGRGRKSDLAARIDRARDEVARTSRRLADDAREVWHDVEGELPFDAAQLSRRARRGGWEAARLAGAGLAALPTVTSRAAHGVAQVVDDAGERSSQLGERALRLADDVPPSRRRRRRQAARSVGIAAGAFAAGAVVGWLVASRQPQDPIEAARAAMGRRHPDAQPVSEVGDELEFEEALDPFEAGDPAENGDLAAVREREASE